MIDFADIAAINALVLLWGASHLLGRNPEPSMATASGKSPTSPVQKQVHKIEFRCEDRRMAEQFAANLVLYGYQANLRSSVTGSLWLVSLQKANQVDKEFVKAIKPFMTSLAKNSKGTVTHSLETVST
jgi:hypothetical protein